MRVLKLKIIVKQLLLDWTFTINQKKEHMIRTDRAIIRRNQRGRQKSLNQKLDNNKKNEKQTSLY